MRASSNLVKWQDGWYRVEGDPGSGPNIEICQAHAGDLGEVINKATAEVETYQAGQQETTAVVDMLSTDPVLGVDVVVGDEVFIDGSWQRIVALTFTFDNDTGKMDVVPQFGTILDSPQERLDRTLAAIGGLSKGTSETARPVQTLPLPNLRPN